MTDNADYEIQEGDEIQSEVLTGVEVALTAVDKAAIDIQIATAKRYPRSLTKSMRDAETMATFDEETAKSMFYTLPRGEKPISGPSTRLAEVMMNAWGNFRADADIVGEDKTHITAMGTSFDLEKNVAVRIRVRRRITNKRGQRFNEDMIGVTGNAAISIALRNSVFKVIPRSVVDRILTKARAVAAGDEKTLEARRDAAIAWFVKAGVDEKKLYEKLGVAGKDDVGKEQYLDLVGMGNMIKEGSMTIETLFKEHSDEPSTGVQDLNDALRKKPEPKPEPTKAEAKKAEAKPAAATTTTAGAKYPKSKTPDKCDTCFRTDGTHDPKAPCSDDDIDADRAIADGDKKK